MIILTNNASLELAPGQSLTFNTDILHTGCAECHRSGSGAVMLRMQQAIYDVDFKANIGATAPGVANLTIFLNGSPMPETVMISTTAAAGDVNNVACNTGIRTCCCGPETVTIVNNGETTVTVEEPLLKIKRVA